MNRRKIHVTTETYTPFEFRTVPTIQVQWGGARRLGELLAPRAPERNALIVTDAGLVKAGLIAPVQESMTRAGYSVSVFDAVVADPPEHVLETCVAQAKKGRRRCGGRAGRRLIPRRGEDDGGRLKSNQDLAAMYGIGNVTGDRTPLFLIPTTAGTGSEVTNIAILTTGETTKMGVVSPQLYADHVLLDAELTLGLPPVHTAATGIDAMVHAIEAYTGKHKKNPLSDAFAREALRLLSGNLITVCREPGNRKAREEMLLGATLAGQAFSNSPVAAVHALAYPLGGHYHVPHGLSNALMLGPVLRFNSSAAAAHYAELGDVVLGPQKGSTEARAAAFVDEMQRLMDESGAPRHLRDVGVTDNSLALLAADAMKQQRLLVNNPVEVTEAHALELYREAF